MRVNKELFLNKKTVAVAVSGGRDSMALLHYIKNNFSCDLIALNVEHGIRGASSITDSLFVKEYCRKNGIPFLFKSVDSLKYSQEKGVSVELAARELRHGFFREVLQSGRADAVALAHHADDNAETILMREFRGTGITGLASMREEENGYIRPFLFVTRKEINEYVDENDIPFVDDETNFDSVYTRNYIRNEIVPVIEKKYPSFRESLLRLSQSAEEAGRFIDARVLQPVFTFGGGVRIPLQEEILFKRAVVSAYKMLGVNSDIEYRHQKLLYELSVSDKNLCLDMPFETKAYKEDDGVVISRDIAVNTRDIEDFLKDDGRTVFKTELCDGVVLEFTKGKIVFDLLKNYFPVGKDSSFNGLKERGYSYSFFDLHQKEFCVRMRSDRDELNALGGNRKSLGDIYTDKKLPLRLRNLLPVVANGTGVYTVLGFISSEDSKLYTNSLAPVACKLTVKN